MALSAVQTALEQTIGHGLERQRIVNLMEAARLYVLAMFGERLGRAGNGVGNMSVSPLLVGASLHFLDRAFCALSAGGRPPDKWLNALGYRMASFVAIVAGPELVAARKEVAHSELSVFLGKDIPLMVSDVESLYREFAMDLGERTVCDGRIACYKKTVEAIRMELAGSEMM